MNKCKCDIKTPGLGFNFETCRAQSVLPAANHSNVRRRITICDVTNTGKQLCSPNEPFVVVLEKGFFLNKISPFGVDFEICNFVDTKHTHYTLTKIQEVKRHNRTPLICFFLWAGAEGFDPLSWETLCPNVSLRAVSDRLSCYVSLSLLASSSEVTTSLSTHWFIWGGWNPILRPRTVRMCLSDGKDKKELFTKANTS